MRGDRLTDQSVACRGLCLILRSIAVELLQERVDLALSIDDLITVLIEIYLIKLAFCVLSRLLEVHISAAF